MYLTSKLTQNIKNKHKIVAEYLKWSCHHNVCPWWSDLLCISEGQVFFFFFWWKAASLHFQLWVCCVFHQQCGTLSYICSHSPENGSTLLTWLLASRFAVKHVICTLPYSGISGNFISTSTRSWYGTDASLVSIHELASCCQCLYEACYTNTGFYQA